MSLPAWKRGRIASSCALEVDDIEAVMQRGLAVHGTEINPIDEYKGAKVASLADPDGNTIELVQLVS